MHKFSLIVVLLIQIGNNLVCNDIPFNSISDCNLTCATCNGKDACKSCPSFLTLSQTFCVAPTNERITYNEYFYSQNIKFDRNLLSFNLTAINVQRFCISDSYKFDVVGLFRGREHLTFTQFYSYQISEISINFRLYTQINSTIVKIQLNGNPAYNISITSGFNHTLYNDSNMLILNTTDIQSYYDKVFIPIRTGMLTLNDKIVIIKIIVENQLVSNLSINSPFWGINELSVAAKKCRTCVSTSLKTLTGYLGIIVGISAGLVVFLVFVLHIYEKIKKDRIRRINRQRYKNSI